MTTADRPFRIVRAASCVALATTLACGGGGGTGVRLPLDGGALDGAAGDDGGGAPDLRGADAAGGPADLAMPDLASSPGCRNGVRDGTESDVDCGGADCGRCVDGKACQVDGDCQSNWCAGNLCIRGDGIRFAAPLDYPTGNKPWAIAALDSRGNGRLDLVTANFSSKSDTTSVLIGNGDGTFGATSTLAVASIPGDVAVGDFNGDGKADYALTCYGSSDVKVRLSTGNGGFAAPVSFATGKSPNEATAVDVNGDKVLDLVVTHESTLTIGVLLGKGNGTFAAMVEYPACEHAESVVAGDFDGDKQVDLVVSCRIADQLELLRGTGGGAFAAPRLLPGKFFAGWALETADLNKDGRLDLCTNAAANGLSVLLGNGDGTFGAPKDIALPTAATDAVIADFSGDGVLDIAASLDFADKVAVMPGNGDGTFQAPHLIATARLPQSLTSGDFNRDGKVDIATVNNGANSVSVYLNAR